MSDLAAARRALAEALAAKHHLRTAALVEALAVVPRERFLPPGPWLVRGEGDTAGPRETPDADPVHVCRDVSVAIDASRQLFNGAPGVVAQAVDALGLAPGHHVLHLGCGLGYYTALIANIVGPLGRVVALEVDRDLAAGARANLAAMAGVDVRHSNGTNPFDETFDAMLVNAGVTHPRDEWLDAIRPGGRLVLPLTATFAAMGALGKGPLLCLTRTTDGAFDVTPVSFVAIYSAEDLRDDALNVALGKAMMGGGLRSPIQRLRRDPHEPGAGCWFHGPAFCFSREK
jgi:protein-L-isoaspartate(D-aspartate) O-methyltransferase